MQVLGGLMVIFIVGIRDRSWVLGIRYSVFGILVIGILVFASSASPISPFIYMLF